MDERKRRRLEAAGWRVGSAADLLERTPAEETFIDLKRDLAAALRARREALALTQVALARRAGSSQSRVAKMEAGDPTVSVDLLLRTLLSTGASRAELAAIVAGSA